jgi:hypothetical protein
MIRSVPDAIASVLDRLANDTAALPAQEDLTDRESSQAGMFNQLSPKELGIPTAQTVPMIGQEQNVTVSVGAVAAGELCPECSSTVAHVEGCLKCFSCGYSKC